MTDYRQPPQPPQPQPRPAAPQPQPAAPQPEGPRGSHVHHSYIWLGSLRTAFMLLAIVVFSSFSAIIGAISEGEAITRGDIPMLFIVIGSVIAGIVVLVALVAVYQVISYKHLYYELGPEEFNLYSGILNKKRVHVPYQRIQSVDQHATLIQRIFGVCSVSIDTAGGAANKAVIVPYVQKTQAEELRRELFARKQYAVAVRNGAAPDAAVAAMASAAGVPAQALHEGANVLDAPAEIWQDVRGVFGGAAVDTGRVTYEYGMSNKELVFTGLSNNTAFFVVVVGIVGAVSQFMGQMAPILSGSMEPLVGNVVATSVRLFGGSLIAAGVATFLAASLVLWLLSAIGACVSYGGFRACRRDNRIEVEHGLLQHRFQGVDVDRVQSVMVKQSFIRRLLGYCELSLGKIDAGTDEDSSNQKNTLANQGIIIHPFVKMNRVPEILAGLVPEFSDLPHEAKPVAKVALRRAVLRQSIWFGGGFWLAVVVTVCLVVFGWVNGEVATGGIDLDSEDLFLLSIGWNVIVVGGYALAAILFVIDVVNAVLWARESSFAYNHRFMQVSNGGLSRETVSFPRQKIQFGCTKSNPLQRRAGTDTLLATTAAGSGGTTTTLIDASHADAMAWLDWLKPGGNQ